MDPSEMARLRYPFPSLMNPYAEALQEHTDRAWIDGEWAGIVPPEIAEGFKKVKTAYMTAFFFPSATWERLIPLGRMMLFSLYQDDVYERATPDLVRHLRQRTVAVARGEITPREAGVPLARAVAQIRTDALSFIPPTSVARWADDLDLYFQGLEAETRHLAAGTVPGIDEYMAMREKALMIHPFLALKEIETGTVLPEEIHDHPVIRRLKSLTVRITGWFNEFQSYDKDMRTGMGNVNLINVLAHHQRIRVDQAREEMFALHDRELDEFVRLQRSLPDFGSWTDAVAQHVHHFSFVISGWRGVDRHVHRYDPEYYPDQDALRATAGKEEDLT
ncbi:terpene synthase [Streptomyces mobaraensis NBRC 13819 = DSM 40847]|uniref:Terpene synthase n=1 Tax=Streptomyces mobaraensis (strain ATCC 29032 / DSM 40847 / JCM 4168 / NBRC 13819 / NCIMB 11159 / IPCR 16-22) TaxID=1223523 RepID=M2ZVM8_STRM1|nr:hypothetical protein [Streptomyces mobaraensis]EME96778.1 terpene synthase family protein [Streptomyces mobaraensis NBRC 13819 = DSM 40847]QTT76829.1 terpene synthase [Streptomyces mobaraensis NBRC 13819 = DSM 40847]